MRNKQLAKSERRTLRKLKWELAELASEWARSNGVAFHRFEASKLTPHLRLLDSIDFWPASSRYFDRDLREWGLGFENLKNHIRGKIALERKTLEAIKEAMNKDSAS